MGGGHIRKAPNTHGLPDAHPPFPPSPEVPNQLASHEGTFGFGYIGVITLTSNADPWDETY